MFIRGYLRASTQDQNAERARDQLISFATEQGQVIASWYVENASGANADRPELQRLLSDAHPGDILLVEAIDRLSRLSSADWQQLRGKIDSKGLRVVALDVSTSHAAINSSQADDFTARVLDAVNAMMLDVLAAVARKDYVQRRERQAQGIAKARSEGKYKGRPKNMEKRRRIVDLFQANFSVRKTADLANASTYMIQDVRSKGA